MSARFWQSLAAHENMQDFSDWFPRAEFAGDRDVMLVLACRLEARFLHCKSGLPLPLPGQEDAAVAEAGLTQAEGCDSSIGNRLSFVFILCGDNLIGVLPFAPRCKVKGQV